MAYFNETSTTGANIGTTDRIIRAGLGLAVIFGIMQSSINGADAYPIATLIATIVVLTGIAGWDPLYAIFRKVMSHMTNMEVMTFSTGNISMPDRALRIGLGLAVLIASLQGPVGTVEAYPYVKIFATLVVLTGIAGWDPLYSAFRSAASKIWNMRPNYSMSHPSLSYQK